MLPSVFPSLLLMKGSLNNANNPVDLHLALPFPPLHDISLLPFDKTACP